MDHHIEFTVDEIPIAQPRPRAGIRAGHAMVYDKKDHPVHAFRFAVREKARQAMDVMGFDVTNDPVTLTARFYLPRPARLDALTGRGASRHYAYMACPIWHGAKPDLDNLLKAVEDALTGVVWHDDAQVCEYGQNTYKQYHERGGRPRVTIEAAW